VYFSFLVPTAGTISVSVVCVDILVAGVGTPIDSVPSIVLEAPRAGVVTKPPEHGSMGFYLTEKSKL